MSSSTLIRQSSSRKPWALAALAAVAAAAAYVWWARGQAQNEMAASQHAEQASAQSGAWSARAAAGEEQVAIPKDPVVGDNRPSDITPEAWDALNKALANEPNKEKERNRLVSYLRYQRAVAQWSEMKDSPNVAGRQALARELVEQMPQHMANGEVNAGEANLLLAAIVRDIEPDPAKQQAWIEAQRKALQSTQTPEQAKALEDERRKNEQFAIEQKKLVDEWRNAPVAEQDPATLEKRLQALREKIYK